MTDIRFRRCDNLLIQPRERRGLDLAALLTTGAARLASEIEWIALTTELDAETPLDAEMLAVLMDLAPSQWHERHVLETRYPGAVIDRLVDAGLLTDTPRDDKHWHDLAAIAHRHLRWRGVDARQVQRVDLDEHSLLDRLGPAPPPVKEYPPEYRRVELPESTTSGLTELASRRATCRNFDAGRSLDLATLSAVLERTYGTRATSDVSGVTVLKKAVPSAGGLHPVEAYLLVRRVDGLAPGLYHYHPLDHALTVLTTLTVEETEAHARVFVAQQEWFIDAPVMVVLVGRFRRNFWKYRRHAKSYRAVILDAGHLSQMQYLVATELGLAAFITAAVNEGDIEDVFGLDPMEEGVLAVTGFGYRGAEMVELEFDPLRAVWSGWDPDVAR